MEAFRNIKSRLSASSDKLEDKNRHCISKNEISLPLEATAALEHVDEPASVTQPLEDTLPTSTNVPVAQDDIPATTTNLTEEVMKEVDKISNDTPTSTTSTLDQIISSSQAVQQGEKQVDTATAMAIPNDNSKSPKDTSGYFSDSATEQISNPTKKRRQDRAKTMSPIPRMFRLSRFEKSDKSEPEKTKDDSLETKVKKESIYSRLVKSTKRDASSARPSKEPLYARIKPKSKSDMNFEPIDKEPESKSTEMINKPEPIYSRFKSRIKNPFAKQSDTSVRTTVSDTTDVVTSPALQQRSSEPIYSVIKAKNKSLERGVSLPVSTDSIPTEQKDPPKEPIYNQPLPEIPPVLPTEEIKVTVKATEITSTSKASVVTLSHPGYSCPKPALPSPRTISPAVSPTLSSHGTLTPPKKESTPCKLKNKVSYQSSSHFDSQEVLTISQSSLGTASDLGERTRLSKLVEELAQELESVSRRTGLHESSDDATKRETLMTLLSNYDVPKNLRPVHPSRRPTSVSPQLRYMDDSAGTMVYADVPDYSQDEFFIALDDETDPKYASITRDIRQQDDESSVKVSRRSAQMYVNVVSVLSALKILINSNSTKAATVINRMGSLAKPYANKMQTSISDTTWLQRRVYHRSGHNGFDELRRYIKSGGEFCKELAVIMHERAELEASYAKGLHKLSTKLLKASRESLGTISDAWQAVGSELEHEGDIHRILAVAVTDDVVRPLRQLIETQYKIRKGVEGIVDKTSKNLHDWRAAEAKAKKNCYHNTKENEKIQDTLSDARLGRGKQLSEKDMQKLEKQRKKAEENVQKSDLEYYSFCVRGERARQDWESAVYKGSNCFQTLEEERLCSLKDLVGKYYENRKETAPKLVASAARLEEPVGSCDIAKDIQTIITAKGTGENCPEQNLPDFYSEDFNNPMNKVRRREALEKFGKMLRSDLDRESRGKQGVENLAKALQETPNFGGEESQQDVNDKLQHMKAMLAYLEATRYKVQTSLDEMNDRPKSTHPLAKHIDSRKDKQGFSLSVLKVPAWVKGHSTDVSPISESPNSSPNWNDREAGDGNSVQPDSDFVGVNQLTADPVAFMYPARYPSLILPTDEFSSASDQDYQNAVNEAMNAHDRFSPPTSEDQLDSGTGTYYARPLNLTTARCKALYDYEANLYDELTITTGDIINIHEKQPDGWWVGELDGNVGIFPATYVEDIDFP